METLEKIRPSTNEQFEAGLDQLSWLHAAKIAHMDIRIEYMFYLDGTFISIDFGESKVIPKSPGPSQSTVNVQGRSSHPTDSRRPFSSSQTEVSDMSFDSLDGHIQSDVNYFIGIWHETVHQDAPSKEYIERQYTTLKSEKVLFLSSKLQEPVQRQGESSRVDQRS